MNEHIREQSKQLLEIEPFAKVYLEMLGQKQPEQGQETINMYLTMVNIIVSFTEVAEMKLLDARYRELLKTFPLIEDADAEGQFFNDAIDIIADVFAKVLQLHKEHRLMLWQPGKGAVLVNGKGQTVNS